MVKKIIACSVLSAALLLSGCGDSDGESAIETQQMLDNGDYEGVIAKITNPTTEDDYMALAAAYMQRAGLGLTDLITVIADSTDSTDDAFVAFIKSVENKSSSTALEDLEQASLYYKNVVTDCSLTTLSSSEEDACLYKGLAQTMKAATTIGYIADDIESFGTAGGVEDTKLKASTCAMQYANAITVDNECTVSPLDANLTFASGRSYQRIQIAINAELYDYLLKGAAFPKTTAITKGYCTTSSFTPRLEQLDGNETEMYYVCPVIETSNQNVEELTTEALIVDALNDGVEAIGGVATEEMQGDIDEFKCEVLGGTYTGSTCSVGLDQDVTTQQVIDYINNNN